MDLTQMVNNVFGTTGQNQFVSGAIAVWALGVITLAAKFLPMKILSLFQKHLTTTVIFSNSQRCYLELIRILYTDSPIKDARIVKVYSGRNYWDQEHLVKGFGPGNHIMKYRGEYLFFTMHEKDSHTDNDRESISITRIGRSHSIFDQLIVDIEKQMFDNTTGVKIYGWAAKDWMYVTKTPHRSLDSVILPDSTLELLKRSLDKFRNSEQWYLDHNIPYQIGIMLHGSPGTGKTSLVKVIASYMKSSVCVLAASQLYALKDSVKVLPTETILVIEDIDTNPITHQRKSKTPTLELAEPSGGASGGDPISPDSPNVSMVGRYLESSDKEDEVESMVKQSAAAYLSDVLNSLDGLFSIHGRILIITTNHPDELDDALVRPGRIDVKIEVGYAKDETFVKFIKKMYDVDYRFPEGCHVKEGVTFAILQNEKIRDVPYESVIEKFVVRYSEPRRGDNG